MRSKSFWTLLAITCVAPACHLDDSSRCGDGFSYDGDAAACIEEGTDTGSDSSDVDADAGADAGDTDDDPTGLMEPCSSQDDCAGYDATYCMLLMTPNVCLLPDCTTAPDDCPDGYTCCDILTEYESLVGVGSLCAPDEDFATYEAYCENS